MRAGSAIQPAPEWKGVSCWLVPFRAMLPIPLDIAKGSWHYVPMTTAQQIQIGTKVSYEDMANPRCEGVVADIETTRWGTNYVIAWNGYRSSEISNTDLRQRGWQIG